MRRTLLSGLIALAAILPGCGDSDDASDSELGPEGEEIARTYDAYFTAVVRGDGEAACARLTPAYRRRAASQVTPTAQAKLEGASCPEAIEEGTLPQLAELDPEVERVQIKGDRASAFIPAQGQFGAQKVIFMRAGDGWKISKALLTQKSSAGGD